jgi:hypothetical protein
MARIKKPTPEGGEAQEETRVSFLTKTKVLEKFKSVNKDRGYRLTLEQGKLVKSLIQDDFTEALQDFIDKHESKYGKVPD